MVHSDDISDCLRTAVCSCWEAARPILPPMGLPEGQRHAIAFDRSDGSAPLALSFLSTERAAFGPRKLRENRADTE
jgi:hypothetical protein